ncbi:putative baseplate assembly protein [Flavisphingomonas formosensis]|uniref:putative baseplate assembly protein n=1 Tax=Flavisphingomonas formosensis TaxID=861534 RepID=UPI0012FA4AC0|nr:putative baseplate assembly protein [Sphingomonas formosensis]
MPLEAPNLDDRRFPDIVSDASALIPRWAPEWTDRNDSDPGIAIAKLFAWMTELTLFRLNQVPERNYVKFLQMVGIERIPAAAARAELQFVPARDDIPETWVSEGTQVAAPADADGPILFETLKPLAVLGAKLAAIQAYDGLGYEVVTTKAAADGQWFYPFGPNARDGSALLLGFASSGQLTAGGIDLLVRIGRDGTVPDPQAGADGFESFDTTAGTIPPPAKLHWEYWDLVQWQPLTVMEDGTQGLIRDGHIVLRGPGAAARKAKIGDVADQLFWLRCRVEAPGWDRAPRLDAVLINCVPAMQASLMQDEVLGLSNARPGQSFALAARPVLMLDAPEQVVGADGAGMTVTSLRLEVDEGAGPAVWQEVPDFYGSGPDDPHFTLNRTTGVVGFGDNVNGRIPAAFVPASGRGNIVARSYLTGGGRRGNLAAGTLTAIQTYLPGISSVTNPYPAEGGAEEETVGAAKLRAAGEIRSNARAVTTEDFEVRALEAGVRRAHALPLAHPRYPGVRIPGAVTVIVVPDSDQPNPMPGATTLATVAAHLDQVRLMTTEVHVAPPRYRLIRIEADLLVRRNADFGLTRTAVEDRLNAFLHPLTGGPDGLGWPFGGEVYFSDIYRLILDTPDVVRIDNGQLVIRCDGEAQPFCRDVSLCPGELVWSNGHDLNLVAEVR